MNDNQLHKKLSIIIPFYNVEQFIGICLESIYKQDVDEDEYEIVCVNDCSPDNSKNVVLEYQKLHSNIRLLEHETNKMQGAARNTGLKAAFGDYVWFIDSDDFIQPNVLKKIITLAESNQLDILHFNIQRVDINGNTSEYHANYSYNTDIITGIDYYQIDEFPIWKRSVETWSRIYKRDFLIDNNLFYEEGVYFEDAVHTIKSILKCTRFQYLNEIVYNYRLNPTSSTMNDGIYSSGRKLADLSKFYIDVMDEFQKNKIETKQKDEILNFYLSLLEKNIKNVFYLSNAERVIFYKYGSNINFEIVKPFLSVSKYLFYTGDKVLVLFNNILSPPIRLLRTLKRNIFK